MEKENSAASGTLLDKLFGGIDMTWPKVILFAVCTAVLTFMFLILPVFKNTSFERMGVYFEAWILFAVFIMSNSKTPLDSALKTFVFFLVSQPLIYLLQVPFTSLGWGIFGYYGYWFKWTLLTLPMAYAGWYITKRNWLSVLIFAPVFVFLAWTGYGCADSCIKFFPHLLVAALFCFGQIVLYTLAFFPDIKQKAAGLLIAAAVVAFLAFRGSSVDIASTQFLPGDPVLTDAAVVETDGSDVAEIQIHSTGEDSMVYVHGTKYGAMEFTIIDGDKEYRYTLEIYEDESGHNQIRITER